ncbi:DUF3261 domain-containing protein [Cellvibrio sp. KY-GH-1]|nr:DUF3261 domain-containing protein [Cellvibrio sp. KY-GH-1]
MSRAMGKKLLLVVAALMALVGCGQMRVSTLETLPLPADQGGNCCWQVLQQLDIDYQARHYQLTAALAQSGDATSLVLLDPLGRRVLSVSKKGAQLEIYKAPELPQDLPARFLLASSLLAWWPDRDWQQALQTQTDWQLKSIADGRQLGYRGKPLVEITYSGVPPRIVEQGLGDALLGVSNRARVRHLRLPLTIAVTNVRWTKT